MNRPTILRARLRERAFTSANDVRRALSRIEGKFWTRATAAIKVVGVDGAGDLAQRFIDHRTATEAVLCQHRAGRWWDIALGAMLRHCELAREAGRLARKERV